MPWHKRGSVAQPERLYSRGEKKRGVSRAIGAALARRSPGGGIVVTTGPPWSVQ